MSKTQPQATPPVAPQDLTQQLAELRSQVTNLVQRQTEASREQVNQKIESFSRLASSIAGDLDSVVTHVLSNCDFLLERAHPGGPLYAYIAEIKNYGEQAVSLIRRLTSFSSTRAFKPAMMNINAIIKTIERQIADALGPAITLSINLTPERCIVRTEPSEMERTFIQFATNAKEFMPDSGSFTIETTIAELSGATARKLELASGKYVSVRIADTGAGMDAAAIARVFEPYSSTKHSNIGLFTAFATVKMCAGAIQCDSVKGKGTVFTIYLPLIEQPADAAAPAAAMKMTSQLTIAVIEEEPLVRSLLRQMLAPQGYRVLEAAKAEEMLKTLEGGERTDLILADAAGQDIVTKETGDRIAKAVPDALLLLMTNDNAAVSLPSKKLESKVHSIQKPFTPLQLRDKLHDILHA